MAASSLGAFGVTETVALFVRNSAWGNIWQRFWVHDGIAWGTSQEKGLSAAFCFLFVVGLVCDWLLHIKIGENPDEKWDRYLADFTAELPNDVQRAGTFQPILSFWDKLLGRHSSFAPIVQHSGVTGMGDGDVKFPPSASAKLSKQPVSQSQRSPRVPESKLGIARLLKKDARKPHPSRRAIRFRPQDSDSTDSENEMTVGKPAPLRTDSSATLVNPMEASLIHPPNRPWDTRSGEIPDYSDSEVDIGAIGRQSIGDSKPWPPAFFRRHSARAALSPIQLRNKFSSATGSAETQSHLNDEEDTSPHRTTDNSLSTLPLEVASIPATPSLIKAVERIQLAHEVVAHPSFAPSSQTIVPGTPQTEHDQRKSWDTFWDDVKTKAHY
ncbi:hypothetical protein BDW22DRAFT_907401 [Trametopsis cervina]|nr:hypothetical protein BDW22DRAFT_907401 [Trametopsis cervina]